MKKTIKKTLIIAGASLLITKYLQNRNDERVRRVERIIASTIKSGFIWLSNGKESTHEL